MADLSVVIPTYGQPELLDLCLSGLDGNDAVEVIVVDDCGEPAVEPDPRIDVLLRVDQDIPWNQPGARNLGVKHASAPVLLLIDVDMCVADLDEHLVAARNLPPNHAVYVGLRYQDGKINLSHPHNLMVHREELLALGGYDEDYCGAYGWDDVQLLHTLQKCKTVHHLDTLLVDFLHDETKGLDRSSDRNYEIHTRKMREIRKLGVERWVKERKGPNLRFPWHRVA